MSHRPLVASQELRELLGRVTVLDVRYVLGRSDGREHYLAGHVPSAAYVDMDTDLADPAAGDERGRHPLPDTDRFGAAMRRCGVSGDRPVVVYDDASGIYAGRAWWLLRYHGHADVRILDGGWSAWVREVGDVESGPGQPAAGDFEATPGRLALLDADGAARLAAEGVLIDARAAVRFRGEVEPLDPVAGHVPGAVNVPTAANLDGGCFRSRKQLEETYRAAGVRPGSQVGVYCGSGVTAAHDVFALHLLGIEAALFAPSWSGWVADPRRPVETGA
jgi:thiosulfate/3-mercaptopyruvate sulfurtransferase